MVLLDQFQLVLFDMIEMESALRKKFAQFVEIGFLGVEASQKNFRLESRVIVDVIQAAVRGIVFDQDQCRTRADLL